MPFFSLRDGKGGSLLQAAEAEGEADRERGSRKTRGPSGNGSLLLTIAVEFSSHPLAHQSVLIIKGCRSNGQRALVGALTLAAELWFRRVYAASLAQQHLLVAGSFHTAAS